MTLEEAFESLPTSPNLEDLEREVMSFPDSLARRVLLDSIKERRSEPL